MDRASERSAGKPVFVLPQSVESERALLCCFFLDADGTVRAVEEADLKAEDFYDSRNALIFRACMALYSEGLAIDFLTVAEKLKQTGFKDVAYLTGITEFLPSPMGARLYARKIKETSLRRRYISIAERIKLLAVEDGVETDELSSEIEKILLDETDSSSKAALAEELAAKEYDFWEVFAHGVKIQKSAVWGIVGATSTGKTDLAMDVAKAFASESRRNIVLFCEYEGTEMDISLRIRKKGDWRDLKVFFAPKPGLLDIAAFVRRNRNEGRILVVIDYLQRLARKMQSEEKKPSDNLRTYVNKAYNFFDDLRRKYSDVSVLFLMSMSKSGISEISIKKAKDAVDMLNAIKESGDTAYDLDYVYGMLFSSEESDGEDLSLSRFRGDSGGALKYLHLVPAKEARIGQRLRRAVYVHDGSSYCLKSERLPFTLDEKGSAPRSGGKWEEML